MIRVTVEMVPKGNEDRAYTMAQGVIINTGRSATVGEYGYGFTRQTNRPGHDPGIGYQGEIGGFPRKRLNVWHLIAWALDDALDR